MAEFQGVRGAQIPRVPHVSAEFSPSLISLPNLVRPPRRSGGRAWIHRPPTTDPLLPRWEKVVAKLARERAGELLKLAEELMG